MKLTHGQASVVNSKGAGESTGFRIATSAHAFRMLSSGLYSDKIGAVLREIGCNAADAHIGAGKKDLPIEVKLPNGLDPTFYIRDRGLGLDDSEVRELYTTYFASSKQTSNDFTGAFGLGSKSPFAYTDSFTITACKDGKMRTYVAHLDKSGSPVITQLGESKASKDWPTGVMLSFPVKPADFDEFREKAKAIYRWFTPLPNILGIEDNWLPEYRAWYDSKTLAYGHNVERDDKVAFVLMGNVLYPLHVDKIYGVNRNRYTPPVNEDVGKHLCLGSVILKLPIGTVQVAASREELQYDEESVAALKKALTYAANELFDMAAQRLKDAYTKHTGWQQRVQLVQLYQSFPDILRARKSVDLKVSLGRAGLSVPEYTEILERMQEPRMQIPDWVGGNDDGLSVKFIEDGMSKRGGKRSDRVKDGEIIKSATSKYACYLEVAESTVIFVGDCDKPEERVFLGMGSGDALLVSMRGRDKRHIAQEVAERISAQMEGLPVRLASALPDNSEVKQKAVEVKVSVLEFAAMGSRYQTGDWIKGGTETSLDKVPVTHALYLVRDGVPGGSTTKFLPEHLDANGERVLGEQLEWDKGFANFIYNIQHCLAKLGLQNQMPKGFILVTPSQVDRLKLLERGFKPLMGYFRDILRGDAFAAALKRFGIDGLPARYDRYYEEPTCSFLQRLRNDLVGDQTLVKALQALPMNDTDRLLFDAILKVPAPGTHGETRETLEFCLGPLWQFLDLPASAMTLALQVGTMIGERYPALRLLECGYRQDDENLDKMLKALPYLFAQLSSAPVAALKAA